MKKIRAFVGGLAAILVLAGCGAGGGDLPTPSVSDSTATTTSTTTNTSTVAQSSTAADSHEPVAEPVVAPVEEVAPEPTAAEPYIVECLFGTPGPTLMSDGSVRTTDHCLHQPGAEEYRAAESAAGLFNAPGVGYQCPGTDFWVDDSSSCTPEIIGPENVAFADGGTCAGAICGYGHNSQGERNPTSGELQTLHGCQEGYITDPELCAAVAWVDGWQY